MAVQKILVTGGVGFIGSAVVRHLINGNYRVVNVDKLTYSGNPESVRSVASSPHYSFHQIDICDGPAIARVLEDEQPDAIMHLAAETHVDRSIDGPAAFVETNVVGTFTLLSAALNYWRKLEGQRARDFRFHHISTDEVFGALNLEEGLFTEETRYDPSSPYSASKAAADHFVRAWHATFGLPVILTNCSNNYGPYHFPEKLIPLVILNALDEKPLPIYGKGENVRDWLYVEDHARALETVLTKGRIGESYNVGGRAERNNLGVVETICEVLDRLHPRAGGQNYRDLITFVADRPGHDLRYAIDCSKLENELGWEPRETFESGLNKTVTWYLENEWWWRPIRNQNYSGERLGVVQK